MSLLLQDRSLRPGVLLLTLNRPERHNALSKPLLEALDAATAEAAADPAVHCIVLTGAGERAFSAGADIKEQTGFTPEKAHAHMRWGQDLFTRIEQLGKPTIAAINGFALGGGLELALACDLRIASESAQIGLPEVTLASLPGWGGTQRLPRLVGLSSALLVALTGARLAARRAQALGIVQDVHAQDSFMREVLDLAGLIASHPLESLQAIKQVMRHALTDEPAAGMRREARAVADLWGSPAQKQAQEKFFSRPTNKPAA